MPAGTRRWNGNRLLAAAARFAPSFVVSLDADERIDVDDAVALRSLVEGVPPDGRAYLFRCWRMVEDVSHYSPPPLWIGRLFSYAPGQVFPDQRHHLVPIPTSIPKSRWVKTTIQVLQRLGGSTEERRRLRFAKWGEVDPDRAFQKSYVNVLEPPRCVVRWPPRLPGLPPIANGRLPKPQPKEEGKPVLSVVIISRNDEATIVRAVEGVIGQHCDAPFETIVVASGSNATARIVRTRFPEVQLLSTPGTALPGRARNAGVRVARGRYVSFPGSHVQTITGSLAARVQAHDLGYAMVTGTVLNGTRSWAGWASYFLDHRTSLPGQPSQELGHAPAHCSYLREALVAIGGFPEDLRSGEDTAVNLRLFEEGYGAYRDRDARLIHYSPCRTFADLSVITSSAAAESGGSFLETKLESGGSRRRLVPRYLVLGVPTRLLRVTEDVWRSDGGLRGRYCLAVPLVIIGALSAWAGSGSELASRGLRRPGQTVGGSSVPEPPPQSAPAQARQLQRRGRRSARR